MLRLQKHIYEWDRVVIGGDLRSLLYSMTNNVPVIFTNSSPPFRFDIMPRSAELHKIGFSVDQDVHKLELWEKAFFILGLSGLCPLSSSAQSIRVKEDTLTITTERQRVIKAKFAKLIIFEDWHLQTLPEIHHKEDLGNDVFDWFNVRYGCRHELEVLHGDDSFISRVHFYPTDRSDNRTLKDAVAVSNLKSDQLENLDYSEYMARFKLEYMMSHAGIKGPINGYKNKKPIYLGIKTEHTERQVVPKVRTFYNPDPRYDFRYDALEDILANLELSSYTKKIANML